jgi:cutinase
LSINEGITTYALPEVKTVVVQCPRAGLVLAGYSQGAMVMHQVEWQLPGSALSHIKGTLLVADGDRVPDTKAAYTKDTKAVYTKLGISPSPARGEGIRTYVGRSPLAPLVPFLVERKDVRLYKTTVSICNADDIVCDFNVTHMIAGSSPRHPLAALKLIEKHFSDDGKIHANSYTSGLLTPAAKWLAQLIK